MVFLSVQHPVSSDLLVISLLSLIPYINTLLLTNIWNIPKLWTLERNIYSYQYFQCLLLLLNDYYYFFFSIVFQSFCCAVCFTFYTQCKPQLNTITTTSKYRIYSIVQNLSILFESLFLVFLWMLSDFSLIFSSGSSITSLLVICLKFTKGNRQTGMKQHFWSNKGIPKEL